MGRILPLLEVLIARTMLRNRSCRILNRRQSSLRTYIDELGHALDGRMSSGGWASGPALWPALALVLHKYLRESGPLKQTLCVPEPDLDPHQETFWKSE